MSRRSSATEVLIVGGGPVGLALALDLQYRGVDLILVEASNGVVSHPRTGTVGPRSMELFRRWGLADKIRGAGWPEDHPLDVAWVTAIGGHEVYRLHMGTTADRACPAYTPEPEQVCPQHWLLPLLRAAVGLHPTGPVRLRCRFDSFREHARGIQATVTDLDEGSTQVIECAYLIAADGARSGIRKACGIAAPASHATRVLRNILFHAPELRDQLGPRCALVHFLVQPGTLRYPLRAMDGRGLYRLTTRGSEDTEPKDAMAYLRDAIAMETPLRVLSDEQWYLTHRVADRYRMGRVFLVGDAAHTLAPAGGFGMNTGIADAADLGWKLAATLAGWGGPKLLDLYESERRPIAVRSLEEANRNLQRTLDRSLTPAILFNSDAGARARATLAEELERSGARREFEAPDIHLGFRYRSSGILSEDEDVATPPNPDQGLQSCIPGARAPHVWLREGSSTLDLFGHAFVLLCFGDTCGQERLAQCLAAAKIPLSIERIDDPGVAARYRQRFVLVRPDGHVAWCGDVLPEEPAPLVRRLVGG